MHDAELAVVVEPKRSGPSYEIWFARTADRPWIVVTVDELERHFTSLGAAMTFIAVEIERTQF